MNRRQLLRSIPLLSAGALVAACKAPPPARDAAAVQPTGAAAQAASLTSLAAFSALDPFEQNKQLGRGVNFGNALEAPTEGAWGMVLEEGFFDLVKQGGFNTIRVPTKWSGHAATASPYLIEAAFFERIDWVVDNTLKRGLNCVLNLHHYDELMTDTDAHIGRFVALWSQIAARYKDKPAQLVFELCNEPNGLPAGKWNQIAAQTLAEVRATNPTRNVVIGPVDWNNIAALPDLKLPESDRHIIVTYHYYSPFQFTHQGAEWVDGSKAWLGTPWKGGGNDKANVDFDIQNAVRWGKKNNRPIWMGEFGAFSAAVIDSRARWTNYVAREAERQGVAWSYWEFGAGFGVYDRARKQWNEPILKALVPPPA
jgi:endoglucanase